MVAVATACPALASLPPTLSTPGLFDSLAFGEVHAYRVEGEWSTSCDSVILVGGSSLDCFVIAGELPIDATAGYDLLLDDLSKCTWTRWPRGWTSPSTPLGLSIRTDSIRVDLLISLRAMKATMTVPGEGTAACDLPDRDFGELAWCVWGLDPESPDVQPFVRDELRRLGMDPDMMPPEDFAAFLLRVTEPSPPEPTSWEPSPQGSSARPLEQVPPQYPEFARVAGIEGTVVLRVRVDPDGRVSQMDVVHSIPGLDTAAKAAVSLWRFAPAVRNGEPIADWVEVPVTFLLRDTVPQHAAP